MWHKPQILDNTNKKPNSYFEKDQNQMSKAWKYFFNK